MHDIFDQMTTFTTKFNQHLEPLAMGLGRLAEEFKPYLQGLLVYDAAAKARETTGWLPYRTVPFDQYFRECGGDTKAFSARVSSYYSNHALDIVKDINARLANYGTDDEAKATLQEALSAHQRGLYRCVCRVLPPEMERVIREDWLAIRDVAALKTPLFEGKINKRSLSDFALDGSHDLLLFDLITSHLFAWVHSRQTVYGESTPNRHAATHGWVAYSSIQSSLNSIICTDYVFRLTTSFHSARREELPGPYGTQL